MSVLTPLLQDLPRRKALLKDAELVLDQEVASKKGIRGAAVKTTFKVIKSIKPGFVPEALDGLLDEFVGAVEPFYVQWADAPGSTSCATYFIAHGSDVAEGLLAITDERARRHDNKRLVAAYNKLRPMGKDHVMAAMQRVGDLIERHTKHLR